MASVIERLNQTNLCCGCGLCAALCPKHTLALRWSEYGEYRPVQTTDTDCSSCGLCLKVCPFANGNPNENVIADQLYNSIQGISHTKETGYYLASGVGHVADEQRRWKSASGGLASWFLEKLLTENIVDAVLCVRKSTDKTRFYQFFIARTVEDIQSSCGSAYYPTEMSEVMSYVLQNPGRYAVIGVPCFVKALRLAQAKSKTLRERIVVIAGLTCGQMKNTHFTDYIAFLSGQTERPEKVYFRYKSLERPASLFSFHFIAKDGRETDIPWNSGISPVWGNRAFTLPSCDYCDDVFAECADITFMDAWLQEYSIDPHGTSFWISRSMLAEKIMTIGQKAGEINVFQTPITSVIESQLGVVKEKRSMLSYRLSLSGLDVVKRVPPDAKAGSLVDRRLCRKRVHIAEMSRRAVLSDSAEMIKLKAAFEKEFKLGFVVKGVLFAGACIRYARRRVKRR